jgi:vancomycin resistance protein VanW
MARTLLTQRFPSLIPLRLAQRRTVKRFSDARKGYRYAVQVEPNDLPYRVYRHQSLLLRRLGDVDMTFQHNKVVNLKLAAAHLDGVLIGPGETFSFWHLVGDASAARGYLPGVVLRNGKAASGVGGGLCQLGNLLHWMFLHSPLEVVERYRHSFDPFPDDGRAVPFGTGATLTGRLLDLKATNTTELMFQVRVRFSDTQVLGEIRASAMPPLAYHVDESDSRFVRKADGLVYRQNVLHRREVDRVTGRVVSEYELFRNDALVRYTVDPQLVSPTVC